MDLQEEWQVSQHVTTCDETFDISCSGVEICTDGHNDLVVNNSNTGHATLIQLSSGRA